MTSKNSTPPSDATDAEIPTIDCSDLKLAEIQSTIAEYQQPSTAKAVWQIVNTSTLYVLLWALMYWTTRHSYLLTLPLAILAGALLVRIFIIFHDCGHGSFFKSRRANDIVGFFAGLLVFTPYYHWRWEHAVHHGTSGDLDRRGKGDLWTMTVNEYLSAPRWKRFAYKLARNPFLLFFAAPLFLFVIRERFPKSGAGPKAQRSVWWTDLGILIMASGMAYLFGIKAYLFAQCTVMIVAGGAGVWMFYVQHQFEGAYWARNEEWNYVAAALQGSSFYRLPKVLQWFTGNIGFHHVHHLNPRIPNYNLERCHKGTEIFQTVKPVTLLSSLKTIRLHLWDEQRNILISFRDMRRWYLSSLKNCNPSGSMP